MHNPVLTLVKEARPGRLVRGRILLISNRLPTFASTPGSRPSSGGLVAGLRHVARRWPTVWIGWDGQSRPEGAAPDSQIEQSDRASVLQLSLSEAEVAAFYRRYSNGVLWPVLHGRVADMPADDEDWAVYERVNRRFAEAVLRHYVPGDLIWIHDYHLFLLPRLIRHRLPSAPIAFFLHTAFPEPDIFGALPHAADLMRGVLGADAVGFHTTAYATNFLRSAAQLNQQVVGDTIVSERASRVHVHPMGIDVDSFATLARDEEVLEDVADIRRGRSRLLVGVDRLDYTKGIPQRLLAFEALLERHPRFRGEVSFYQLAVPSREEIPAYRDLRQVVERLVARINSRFSRAGWLPVEYLFGSMDLASLVALYRAADVMVVSPMRDGLNLVAKEFVASRVDGDGVLVLSRFAGAAQELSAALQVDPSRILELAETYRRALTMSVSERRKRMRSLRRAVNGNTIVDWASDFLRALRAAPRSPRGSDLPRIERKTLLPSLPRVSLGVLPLPSLGT